MRETIRVVFPNTRHRLCTWHLYRNVVQHVKNSKNIEEFKSLMYSPYTPEKFESGWKRVVDNYDVSSNRWVNKTYRLKRMWASAYMQTIFCVVLERHQSVKAWIHLSRSMSDTKTTLLISCIILKELSKNTNIMNYCMISSCSINILCWQLSAYTKIWGCFYILVNYCICKLIFSMDNKRKQTQNDGEKISTDFVTSPLSNKMIIKSL